MLDNCWSSRLDTMVFDYSKLTNSRMVIDACKPYEHYDRFPKVAMTSPDFAARIRAKWPELYK
jgi:hypothetical protein